MKTISQNIAQYLLQIKAIKLQPSAPFTWASGWKSPIYCDNRKTLSHPQVRTYIRDAFAEIVKTNFVQVDVVAGVATGAIAHGALAADKLNLPFVYVRSAPKGHGLENLIEGEIHEGQKVVVIEDLISTGGSSLKAVEALRLAKCEVLGLVAIFTYNFPVSEQAFQQAQCPLYTLSNYEILMEEALSQGYISSKDIETLKAWRTSPETWGK